MTPRHPGRIPDPARNHQQPTSDKMFAKPMRPPPEERPLHPSWEAKKKLKEKDSGAIVAPQNKRITFDD